MDRLHDDVLAEVLRRVAASAPASLLPLLLVCKRFRDVLLSAATSATVTLKYPMLLRHCRALRALTVRNSVRLPWLVSHSDGGFEISPASLRHLVTLTRVDLSGCCAMNAAETAKLRCLPALAQLHIQCNAGGLEQLPALAALRRLALECDFTLGDAAMAPLAGLAAIRHLELRWNVHTHTVASAGRLAALTALEHLQLDWPQTLMSFEFVSRLTGLTHLGADRISFDNLADVPRAAQHLAPLTSLLELKLTRRRDHAYVASDKDMSVLAAMPSLTALIASERFTDAGLEKIAPLSNLRELDLSASAVSSLPALTRLGNLTSLDLSGCAALDGPRALAAIAGLRQLQHLDLGGSSLGLDEVMEHVSQLVHLTRLDLGDLLFPRSMSEADVARLVGLTALVDLDVGWNAELSGAAVQPIGALTALTSLYLSSQEMDIAVGHLRGLSSLLCLCITTTEEISDVGLAALGDLTTLTHLALHFACGIESSSGLQHLTRLSRLLVLHVRAYQPDRDVPLRCWTGMPQLRELAWDACKDVQGGWDFLQGLAVLTSLQSLTLTDCQCFDSDDIHSLSRLTALTELNVLGCQQVHDFGLRKWSALRSLAKLRLAGTELTDAAVGHLSKLRALTWLNVSSTRISPEAAQTLSSALPDIDKLLIPVTGVVSDEED